MKIVSACMAGIKCNYRGEASPCKKVIELVKQGKAIPVCPEQLAGFLAPRESAEIVNGKILLKDGTDLTKEFQEGAKKALEIAQQNNCNEAILQSRSPSCGSGKIYDGNFSGKLIDGDGVFAKLLKKNGIKVFTEKEI
ncbi:MAG: DUF523 domain-containing protein [archaeon]